MTPVHKKKSHHDVLGPFVVVETVVQHDKGAGVNGGSFIRFHFFFHLLEDGFLAPILASMFSTASRTSSCSKSSNVLALGRLSFILCVSLYTLPNINKF